MAPLAYLRSEIGLEGFALQIDRFHGAPAPIRPYTKGVFPARHGRWAVQVPNHEMEEPAGMNTKEVAARFGGIMAVDYFKGKPQIRCAR